MTAKPILIVGSGLAGYTVAREFRKLNKEALLTLVTRDDGVFYSKPMLSNALTLHKTPELLAIFSAQDMAGQLHADVFNHTTLAAIDPAQNRATLQDAQGVVRTLEYAKLVLALGADPVHARISGAGAEKIFSINDLADYARFRAALNAASRIAILGAGLVGCEFANDLCSAQKTVHVLEPSAGPLMRFLTPTASAALKEALEKAGVHWHLGTLLTAVHQAGDALTAVLSKADGGAQCGELEVDLILSAIGLRPRLLVAQTAGLSVKRGIVTDRFLRTSNMDIFALGDCAEVEGHVLPFVQPLMNAARAIAKTLNGELSAVSYPAMPVLVKTPAYPVVVLPPPEKLPGQWKEESIPDGVKARYFDAQGAVRGFALTGAATAEKSALVKNIPGLL